MSRCKMNRREFWRCNMSRRKMWRCKMSRRKMRRRKMCRCKMSKREMWRCKMSKRSDALGKNIQYMSLEKQNKTNWKCCSTAVFLRIVTCGVLMASLFLNYLSRITFCGVLFARWLLHLLHYLCVRSPCWIKKNFAIASLGEYSV